MWTNVHQEKPIVHLSPSVWAIYSIIGVTGEQQAKRENEKNCSCPCKQLGTCHTLTVHVIVKSVEIGNSNVQAISSHTESAPFNSAVRRSLYWTWMLPSAASLMFMHSACDLWRSENIKQRKRLLPLGSRPSGWPSLSHLVQLNGWLTFKKCDFRQRLCIRGDAGDGVFLPRHPRCCHVHLEVWLGRRDWTRGTTAHGSYLWYNGRWTVFI